VRWSRKLMYHCTDVALVSHHVRSQ
jgi:hypothetical protein